MTEQRGDNPTPASFPEARPPVYPETGMTLKERRLFQIGNILLKFEAGEYHTPSKILRAYGSLRSLIEVVRERDDPEYKSDVDLERIHDFVASAKLIHTRTIGIPYSGYNRRPR